MKTKLIWWRASGLDARFVAAQGIAMFLAPFIAVILLMLFQTRLHEDHFNSLKLLMIVLIAGAYGLAEAVLALPYTAFFGIVAWLLGHVSLTKLGMPHPWPSRLGIVGSGIAVCIGRALYWLDLQLPVTDRIWEVVIGVMPAAVFAGLAVYRSDIADDNEEMVL